MIFLVWDYQRTTGEIAEGGSGCGLRDACEFRDELRLDGLGEVGERGEDFGFRLGERVKQIAEDELQRVVSFWRAAEESEGGGDGAASSTAKLSGHPADEERVAAGFLVEVDAVFRAISCLSVSRLAR